MYLRSVLERVCTISLITSYHYRIDLNDKSERFNHTITINNLPHNLPGVGTPLQSSSGFRSTSGISSVTSGISGLATPSAYASGAASTMRARGIHSVSGTGINSASLTPGPQLFQVLEEQKRVGAAGGVFPSAHGYGIASRMAGLATPGVQTPAGIATPGMNNL